jgi:hypothetical protein
MSQSIFIPRADAPGTLTLGMLKAIGFLSIREPCFDRD